MSHSVNFSNSGSNTSRFDHKSNQVSSTGIWKKLYNPHMYHHDDKNPNKLVKISNSPELEKEQMARRMDRKVIKLEAAFGSERQSILVKRNTDLIVRDLMEEVQRIFKIPIEEQVIFHKGTNLCDFLNETLESLGIENNHMIRVTRDPQLPTRSPRSNQQPNMIMMMNGNANGGMQFPMQPPQNYPGQPNSFNPSSKSLDPLSYLKEISPQRVPDPTPYQVQIYNQSLANQRQVKMGANDVLKLNVSYGSEREYLLVHGKKPLMILDLKLALSRQFKIAPDQQCIVYKGYNLHEYLDDAPLDAFGLENNSSIAVWPKGSGNKLDLRLPRGSTPPPSNVSNLFSPRVPHTLAQPKWNGTGDAPAEVIKIEVQHGSDRHQIILKGQNKTLTVLDLQNELEKVTAVPVKDQRLFFKAQELHLQPFKTLKECDLENNHVLKLVGEPSKLRYSNYFGKLMPVNTNQNQQPFPNNMNQNQQQFPNNMNQYQNQNSQQQPFFQPQQPYQQQGYANYQQ